jgi:hypothetical protein
MKQELWVIEYSHPHGTDLLAYTTEAEAIHAEAVLCTRESHSECTAEIALQVQNFFALGHDEEAIALYFEYVADESMTIHRVQVEQDQLWGFSIVEWDSDVVHSAQTFPSGQYHPGASWCARLFFWVNTDVTFPAGTTNFKAWIPREPRVITCLSCIAMEYDA